MPIGSYHSAGSLRTNPIIGLMTLFLFFGAGLSARAAEPQRWALLVGVGDNVNSSNILHGPVNDIAAMTDLLCGRYGFSRDHLHVLLDRKATRQGILDGWDWLTQHVHSGDQVVFYYSGHGIDVPDATKASGLDSAICPFDALHVSGLITGKEIGERIDRLPTDQVVAIVDACCSATATRDIRSHSRSPNPATFGLKPMPHPDASAGGPALFVATPGGHPQKERYIGAARIDQSAHECAFLVDSAASSNGTRDKSREANPNMGALTFYLLKELRADPDGKLSYDSLTCRVRGDLAADFTDDPQEPQVSGPELDVPFLALTGGRSVERPAALPVAAAGSAGGVGATVTLRALAGATLTPGAVLQGTGGKKWTEVGAPTPANPAEAAVLVRVTGVTGASATAAVIAGSIYAGAPLIEVMSAAPDGRLVVAVSGSGGIVDRLRRAVGSIDGVSVVPPNVTSDVTLYASTQPGQVDIFRSGVALPAIAEAQVPATISGMQKVKRLADLANDSSAAIHMSIQTLDGKTAYSEARIDATIGYAISVDRDSYLTILDIAADGSITGTTLPEQQKAGVAFNLPPATVTGPPGLDTVKVIATLFPVQFSLPGNRAECEQQGSNGRPEAVSRRVLSVLRSAAGRAAGHRAAGDADNGPIASAGWGTADMFLRVDP